jgi:hypothetical protein
MKQPPSSSAPRDLPERIAEHLFTNGDGQRAERLVLTVDGPPKRDLGGWCFAAVVDYLRDQLAALAVEASAGSVTLSATDARALAFLLARAIHDDAEASDDDRREARKLLDKLGGDTQ